MYVSFFKQTNKFDYLIYVTTLTDHGFADSALFLVLQLPKCLSAFLKRSESASYFYMSWVIFGLLSSRENHGLLLSLSLKAFTFIPCFL